MKAGASIHRASVGGQLDYGLIGNCQISALIDRLGRISWCCMPRLDSSSIFGALLDESRGGFFSVEPEDWSDWSAQQEYLTNTNILRTVFESSDQSHAFEVVDFCPRYLRSDRIHRPVQLARIVRPLRGVPLVRVRCQPRPGYGSVEPRAQLFPDGIQYAAGSENFFLSTDFSSEYILSETPFQLQKVGRLVFSYGSPYLGSLRFDLDEELERTSSYWKRWSRHCHIPLEFQSEVLRSALALKLHIFEDTGAIIAATTTSIPEGPQSGRTWDYRYCWLRDAYFVITALGRLGQFDEIENFITYLQNICATEKGSALQPVYGISGERSLEEKTLSWLSGFSGHGPVRVGNAAFQMEQHDVYGEMVLALSRAFFDQRMHRTDLAKAFEIVRQLVEQASLTFDLPDSGIWEFRGKKQHSTFSKIMGWAALDCGVQIAKKMGAQDVVEKWIERRVEMEKVIHQRAWNEMVGYYTQSFGGDSPDSANLLMFPLNFLSAEDERMRSTVDAYDRLLRAGLGVFRYRTPDDFGVPNTTFTVCAFWLADALWSVGRKTEARELFCATVARSNHLGLLSEDFDPDSGALWGNFPQTYSHVGLINTAWRLSRPWEDAFK